MNISDNISESLRYPLNSWVKILILGIILIIPIVNFIVIGYYLRIIKASIAGIEEAPDFDDIGELFIDGIKITVVSIVYMLVPIILILIGLVFFPFIILGVISAILLGLIWFIALANMALYDGDFNAAFNFNQIMKKTNEIGWGNIIIWYIAIFIVGMVILIPVELIGIALSTILVGFLVITIGIAYVYMFQASIYCFTL